MAIAEAWFCAQWPIFVVFEVYVWIIVWLEDTNMVHYKISNRVSHLLILFNLLVFDRNSDAMCLNKMSRTSSRNIGPQHHKYSSIFHCTHGELFIPVFTKPILSICCYLKTTSLVCEAQLSFAAHQKYILWFFSLWWMIKGIWDLFSLLFICLWNRKPWLDNFMFIITPGVLKIMNMNGNIFKSDIFYS